LVEAYQSGNDFNVSKIVRQYSPLLDKKTLAANPEVQMDSLQKVETAVDDLIKLWNNGTSPICVDVIRAIHSSRLFKLSERTEDTRI